MFFGNDREEKKIHGEIPNQLINASFELTDGDKKGKGIGKNTK
jgi:hypothetical protein